MRQNVKFNFSETKCCPKRPVYSAKFRRGYGNRLSEPKPRAKSEVSPKPYPALKRNRASCELRGTALYQAVHCDATGQLLAVTTPRIEHRFRRKVNAIETSEGGRPTVAASERRRIGSRSAAAGRYRSAPAL